MRRTAMPSSSSGFHKCSVSSSYGPEQMSSRSSSLRSCGINEKTFHAMEIGHKVCKLLLLKRWEPVNKKLMYNRETRQLLLTKYDTTVVSRVNKPLALDLRHVKEVQTLDFKLFTIKIQDKWAKDKEIKQLDASRILLIAFGTGFLYNYWILLFESVDVCHMWHDGIQFLTVETLTSSHALIVERWLRKEFYNIECTNSQKISQKYMKPFVQTKLQYKIQTKQLQEITEEEMTFDSFSSAYRKLIFLHDNTLLLLSRFLQFFTERFSLYSDGAGLVSFNNFFRFLKEIQCDELGAHRERASEYLRRYLRELDLTRDIPEPSLSMFEFSEYLFSRENSLWDPVNNKVVQDMTRPLSHYWIASSHNTYLTGDQLKSESSLDAYARSLLMGCRCIELDCWDGQKRRPNDYLEIVIYHGYTMTSKLNLRDVLQTIRHYAFINSDYPVILSIEDNCSVPAQRLLAQEVKEILGDYLLTTPVNRDEVCLPSPDALKRKIILKHKKLPVESEDIAQRFNDDDGDQDILSRECVKRGILSLKNNTTHEWTKHIFVLLSDRLCYLVEQCENVIEDDSTLKSDSVNSCDEDETQDDTLSLIGFGVRPEEMHVTEEWFHGKTDRDTAKARLLQYKEKGDGLFLVRNSTIFIGDFSLSFLHNGEVHHCRIRTRMVNGEKKYYFLENKQMDTLYELISYYTKEKLKTPHFSTTLVTPCPQPSPHLNMPWFDENADKNKAEQLLNAVVEDGAFLVRYSSSDKSVFVLSLRVDGEIRHYRLKRDGRIFVVNQTVFENLNQIVEFYSTREFVRGVSLRYPVNEKNVGKYTSDELHAVTSSGCYMELNDLGQVKETYARALNSYKGTQSNELSFPANAVITVLQKEGLRWRGKYRNQTGFFPSNYVTEIEQCESTEESINYVTIELAGSVIEKVSLDETDHPFAFKISQAAAHWNGTEHILAASSSDDQEDWLNTLYELTRSATDRAHILRIRENDLRIASELSNLVVYCQAVPFNPQFATQGNFYEMCSFSETKYEKLLEKGLAQFNMRQISRVYPMASRVRSGNYNPIPMWNSACQMVALNYQTGDKPMQLNQGKFMANGRCGYVLKPAYMIDELFSPDAAEFISTSCPINLTIQVVGGRHLYRKDKSKGICSPFVEVEIIGFRCDYASFRTRTIGRFTSNGLNPIWNETFQFPIRCPEVALLRFNVEDGDFVTDPFIGQAVFPVDCIRSGFRSVILRNQHSEELELSSLLVFVDIRRLEGNSKVIDPHTTLQAGRTLIGMLHSNFSSSFDVCCTAEERKLSNGTLQSYGANSQQNFHSFSVFSRNRGGSSGQRSASVDNSE
uniref:Phosphoinositide phospholipase C n=1 Tax=Syphacia muris TaxID=451379 RepID=A0A158R5P8_9BILA